MTVIIENKETGVRSWALKLAIGEMFVSRKPDIGKAVAFADRIAALVVEFGRTEAAYQAVEKAFLVRDDEDSSLEDTARHLYRFLATGKH